MKEENSNRTAGTEPEGEALPTAESASKVSGQEKPASPRRYKLYDRFADHVSVRTMDIVIIVTSALIIGLLIYGIVTAG